MKKEDFRVVEYNGKFRVQRLFETTEGRGRKKRTATEWHYVSDHGNQPFYFRGMAVVEPMKSFKTLDVAWAMVDIIIQGYIYHHE